MGACCHQPSSRFCVRLCLERIRQSVEDPDTQCPPLASVYTWACTPAHTHVPVTQTQYFKKTKGTILLLPSSIVQIHLPNEKLNPPHITGLQAVQPLAFTQFFCLHHGYSHVFPSGYDCRKADLPYTTMANIYWLLNLKVLSNSWFFSVCFSLNSYSNPPNGIVQVVIAIVYYFHFQVSWDTKKLSQVPRCHIINTADGVFASRKLAFSG